MHAEQPFRIILFDIEHALPFHRIKQINERRDWTHRKTMAQPLRSFVMEGRGMNKYVYFTDLMKTISTAPISEQTAASGKSA